MVIEKRDKGKVEAMAAIVVCADDYGVSHGVCDAVDTLIGERRISATSAMTLFPEWRQRAADLKAIAAANGASVGLHLTLTDHEPLARLPQLAPKGVLPGLTTILRAAKLRRLPVAEVEAEIKAQFDAFEDAFDGPPAFVDGHQHVHAFPVVRWVLMAEVTRRYDRACAMRVIAEPLARIVRRGVDPVKAMILSNIGMRHAAMCRRAGLTCNDSFRGAYNFEVPYGRLFRRFLDDAGGHPALPLIFCHPGHADAILRARSTLVEARTREFAYLSSAQFFDDCARAGRALVPFQSASLP